jgi:5-methylcytosine-specific restriction enzyme B
MLTSTGFSPSRKLPVADLTPGSRPISRQDLRLPEVQAERDHPRQAVPLTAPNADAFRWSKRDELLYDAATKILADKGGVIFAGAPGTGKTRIAEAVAARLTNQDEDRVRLIQFHPSFSYEQFIEGFAPKDDATGFEPHLGHFAEMCNSARDDAAGDIYVIVIDELSRADVGRVFGEALTYVEHDKRGKTFRLASGREFDIPPNLYVLATMNPYDKGVDGVDAAFERRFGRIEMEPSEEILAQFFDANQVPQALRTGVLRWFRDMNRRAKNGTPLAAIGHSYFKKVRDTDSLDRLWEYELRHRVDRAFRLVPTARAEVESLWAAISAGPRAGDTPDAADPDDRADPAG